MPSLVEIAVTQLKKPRYKDYFKNHMVGIDGHAIDGYSKFIATGEEGSLDALKCAACNCHRRETEGGEAFVFHHHNNKYFLPTTHTDISAIEAQVGTSTLPTCSSGDSPSPCRRVQVAEGMGQEISLRTTIPTPEPTQEKKGSGLLTELTDSILVSSSITICDHSYPLHQLTQPCC
ncbi:unnamed protein product [Fraxinus pennsylvanica]|uniref:ZF-HD dimerization-type domain-containing protein n=1 Tax=Fraxinus pennsylvanica TaxID=56036 RepID=A0AAD2DYQ4_9LAMI|nr:unnamed protein product [Fraxinus pennsylvanica]